MSYTIKAPSSRTAADKIKFGNGNYSSGTFISRSVVDTKSDWILKWRETSKTLVAEYDHSQTNANPDMKNQNYVTVYTIPYTSSTKTYDFDGNKNYKITHQDYKHLFLAANYEIKISHNASLIFADALASIRFNKTTTAMYAEVSNTGTGTGDPYIQPLEGPIYKLPDKKAIYRLFESNNIFINGSVSEMSIKDRFNLIEQFLVNGHDYDMVENLILDAYYFDKFYINSENNDVLLDIKTGDVFVKTNYFTFNIKRKYENNELVGATCTDVLEISWKHSTLGKQKINVKFYKNPQINNGIGIETNIKKNCIGCLVKNYNPILMEIPEIKTLKYNNLHKKLKNSTCKFINKGVKEKDETWIRVKLVKLT